MFQINFFKKLTLSFVIVFYLFTLEIDFSKGLTEVSTIVPAISLDYKIHVDAGKEDCYHQYIMPGSVMYINFQVIKGGDGQAGFGIKDPNGFFVLPYEWKTESSYHSESTTGGYYSLCIDNQFAKFSSKLVSVYLNSYIASDWQRYAEELEKLEVSVANFTTSLTNVDTNMASVLQFLHHSRARESRDFSLLDDNKFYISFWSFLQCLIIIGTGGFQLYFIRKLFDSPASGKTRVRL